MQRRTDKIRMGLLGDFESTFSHDYRGICRLSNNYFAPYLEIRTLLSILIRMKHGTWLPKMEPKVDSNENPRAKQEPS